MPTKTANEDCSARSVNYQLELDEMVGTVDRDCANLPPGVWLAEHILLPKEAVWRQDDHLEAHGEPSQKRLHHML